MYSWVKPHLREAEPKPFLALGWSPSIKSLVNPGEHVRPRLKPTVRLNNRPFQYLFMKIVTTKSTVHLIFSRRSDFVM